MEIAGADSIRIFAVEEREALQTGADARSPRFVPVQRELRRGDILRGQTGLD